MLKSSRKTHDCLVVPALSAKLMPDGHHNYHTGASCASHRHEPLKTCLNESCKFPCVNQCIGLCQLSCSTAYAPDGTTLWTTAHQVCAHLLVLKILPRVLVPYISRGLHQRLQLQCQWDAVSLSQPGNQGPCNPKAATIVKTCAYIVPHYTGVISRMFPDHDAPGTSLVLPEDLSASLCMGKREKGGEREGRKEWGGERVSCRGRGRYGWGGELSI